MGKHYDLVIFDMDGVLTGVNSSWKHVHDTMGTNNDASVKAFNNGEITEDEFIRRDVSLWISKNPKFGDKDLLKILRSMPITNGIQETIACLKFNDIKSVICSGGLRIAAEMIANEFGFDGFAAVELEKNADGSLNGGCVKEVDLADKGIRTEQFINDFKTVPERTVSIGNSYTDIKMFEKTGLKIAFNPIDDATAKAADYVVKSKNISDVLDIILGIDNRS